MVSQLIPHNVFQNHSVDEAPSILATFSSDSKIDVTKFLDKSDEYLQDESEKAEFVSKVTKDEKVMISVLQKRPKLIDDLIEEEPELLAKTLLKTEEEIIENSELKQALKEWCVKYNLC